MSEPILPPQPIDVTATSKAQQEYVQFCLKSGLFLNPWVGNKGLSPGITDEIAFGSIVRRASDKYFVPELLRILSEIKESFATARYYTTWRNIKAIPWMLYRRWPCIMEQMHLKSKGFTQGVVQGCIFAGV